jgi:type 1 glutamine amidotransferase
MSRHALVALFVSAAACAQVSVPFRRVIVDNNPPRRPHCKTAGDLDGDKLPDLLAASDAGEGLYWYRAPSWAKIRIDDGAFTTDMQAGDVDGDGDLDVVIPRTGTGTVWYENPRPAGDPAIASWKRRMIGAGRAHDVEVGDVDRDGRLDVVVRFRDTQVLLQRDGGRWAKVDIPTGGRGGTALGDLDGDGDLDIAENGYWLEAPADLEKGTWTRHDIAEGWPDDCGVAIADINKDGRPDVVMVPAETKGKLAWFETARPRQGPWTEHVIEHDITHVHTFKLADIDRNGTLDVVTAETEQSPQGRVRIHYNLGKALRWSAQVVGRSGSHNLRVVDIGNDGDLDIIGANHGNHGDATPLDVWENLSISPGTPLSLNMWQRHVIDAARPARAVFVGQADLDGDGRIDVITGGWWYGNPGNPGGEWKRRAVGEGFRNFAIAYDFDGDGDMDLLGTQGEGSERRPDFIWAENDGKGAFVLHTNFPPKPDGDFLQGIAVLRTSPRGVIQIALSWHKFGKGIHMLRVPKQPASEPWTIDRISDVSQDEALSTGDIGRDVTLDLLLGTRLLRTKDGKSWIPRTINPAAGHPDRNKLVDMNGDGRLDAVVGYEAINVPGKLVWYEQGADAEQAWEERPISEIVGPMSVDVADVDRDGDNDVVAGEHNYKEPRTAKLHVFENLDGKGLRWRDHVVHTGDEHHDGAQLVDIDRDGDLDILSIGWSHSNVLLYENKAIPLSPEDKARIDQVLPAAATVKPVRPRRLLLLNMNVRDDGRRPMLEPAMPYLNYVIAAMGRKTGAYTTVFTTDIESLRPKNIGQFDAICFNNTTGVLTNDRELRESLLAFVAKGKGYAGFHAGGAATFVQYPRYDQFPAFGEMVGGYEDGGHPWSPQDTIRIRVEDPKNPVNAAFQGQDFSIQHQVMQFRKPFSREILHVLLSIDVDASDYDAGRRRVLPERRVDRDFPMSWIKRYHQGRVFYTVFGHNADIAWNPTLLKHFLAGIQYALGDLKADDSPGARPGESGR